MAPKPSIKYVYDGIYSALHLEALFYWLCLDFIYSEISKVLVEKKLRGGELYKYQEENLEKIKWENMRILYKKLRQQLD
jgi:hypothetical protein